MISQKSQNMIQTGPGSNLGVLQVPDTLASVLLSAGPTAAKLPTQIATECYTSASRDTRGATRDRVVSCYQTAASGRNAD